MKNKQSLYIGIGFLALGLLLGWVFFSGTGTADIEAREEISEAHAHEANEIWTCAMHSQIQEDEPGQCPICGMDLSPVAGVRWPAVRWPAVRWPAVRWPGQMAHWKVRCR